MRIFKLSIIIGITFLFFLNVSICQENMTLTSPGLVTAPFATVENNGNGCLTFSIQNVNLPGYDSASTEIHVELSKIAPHNGIESVTSNLGLMTKYEWNYDPDSNAFRANQIVPIGFLYSEDINICFKVIEDSDCDSLESVGFLAEVFILSGDDGNTTDNVTSSYSCTSEEASGIDESRVLDPNIKVYPNPSSGQIIIESDFIIDRVEFFNVLGQKVHSQQYKSLNIDISHLYSGLYIVRLLSKENELIGLKELNLVK